MAILLQNLEKKGLKRRAEAAVEAAPPLMENANSSYAIPEHHRSYGTCTNKPYISSETMRPNQLMRANLTPSAHDNIPELGAQKHVLMC